MVLLASAPLGTLPGRAQSADLPDLVPAAIVSQPANLSDGDVATFVLTVGNLGNASSLPTNATFYVDDVLVGNATVPTVEANATANVTSPPWNATLGNHTVRVLVDALAEVEERDEANNEFSKSFLVAPAVPDRPDLLVLDVGPFGGSPELGEAATFQARVLNAGQGAAGLFRVQFVLDQEVLGNVTVPRLAAGEGITVRSARWNATGGNHTIVAVADAGAEVPEVEEANNDFTFRFRAAAPRFAGPDLRVSEVLMEPPHPLPGEEVVFTALVENPGTKAGAFDVRFVLDNATLGSERLPGLGANDSVFVKAKAWNATAGEHRLIVEAEPAAGSNDTSRLNNALPFDFRVPRRDQRADLVLDVLTVPAVIEVGDRVRLTAALRNNGTWPSLPTVVRFHVDGKLFGDAALEPLSPGQGVRVASPLWNATRGPHLLQAKVDPEWLVPNDRRANNLFLRNLTVPQGDAPDRDTLPDLAIANFTWAPVDAKPGDPVVLRVQVRNLGNRSVEAFQVDFLVDGQLLDRQQLGGIGTIPADLASRPWKAELGRHTFGVRLDSTELRREQEEGNNVHYAVMDVAAPRFPFAREVPAPPAPLALALLALAASLARPRRED